MGEYFSTIPELLEANNIAENGVSKFYEALASILPHITPDNFMNTRVVISVEDLETGRFGDMDCEVVSIFNPQTFSHQIITNPEVLYAFNQDTGLSVDHLDSYVIYWESPQYVGASVEGVTSGFVFANNTAYLFNQSNLDDIFLILQDSLNNQSNVPLNGGNDLNSQAGHRPAIKSLELQACGELATLTPVEISVDVVDSDK